MSFTAEESAALLSPAEAAARLGVSDETVRRWAKAKKIRHVVLPSGQIRFAPADVDGAFTVVEVAAS